jgi:hypothetical protein
MGIPASQFALCNRLHKVVGNCSGRAGGVKSPLRGRWGALLYFDACKDGGGLSCRFAFPFDGKGEAVGGWRNLVDALDLGSSGFKPCGFKSRPAHQKRRCFWVCRLPTQKVFASALP